MYPLLILHLLLAAPAAAALMRQERTPVSALAWLLAILLVPAAGSILYLLAGYRRPVHDVPATDTEPPVGIERMLWLDCATRIRRHNRVEQLHDGSEAFAALIAALQGARHYIHLSYYIFADDRVGMAFGNVLMRKARAGVEVRLLYDAVGSWKLSKGFVQQLRSAGVEVHPYAPLRFPWLTPRANRRNHSKIAVIDGRVGFIGGINIAERYLDGDALGRWRDEHLRIEGEAVADLQRLFAADWIQEGGAMLSDKYQPAIDLEALPLSPLQIAWTREDHSRHTLSDLFAQLIDETRHTLRLSSPYFLPPPALYEALLRALRRGCRVLVMLPDRSDVWLARRATDSYLGRLLDAEGKRLIYPIINHMDEVIAFGGRIMEKTDRAKYKNTRETMLFNKSKNLYNVNLVKKLKRASGLSSLIMVEGYMDAISLYQAGFQNVVASMGTSLTKEQARLCKRYSDSVLISYDGDFAGQKANLRGLEILQEEGIRVRVVPMPEGMDPDDVIRRQGAEGYRKCLDAAMPLIDFRILAVQRKYDLSRTDDRRDFVREALDIVRESDRQTEREELLKRISRLADVSFASLARDLEAARPERREGPPPVRSEGNADLEVKAARFILAACLLSKPYAAEYPVGGLVFGNEEHRKIAAYIEEGRRQGMVRPSGLFDLLDADGELGEILNLDFGDNLDGPRAARFFADSVRVLERRSLQEKIAALNERYRSTEDLAERRAIAAELNELTKKLRK